MENKELFNNKTKEQPAQRQPMQLGLYDATNEHDACGVGMLVNIHGSKSHELVESALKVLENMRHRGAEGADNKTGDGAGIMLQIPHEFILLQGIPVPEKGKYGTGLLFLPKDEKDPEHQSGHQNRAWYKTIVVNLKRFAENDEKKYLQLLEKPFASAELLLGNNSADALKFLCQVE